MQLKGTWLVSAALVIAAWSSIASAEQFPDSEWTPTEMNAESFVAEHEVFIGFEAIGRYFGNGGCNNFSGQFVTNKDAILFGPAAATRKACPDLVSRTEYDFLQTLDRVRGFDLDAVGLSLMDNRGDVVLRLRRKDAD